MASVDAETTNGRANLTKGRIWWTTFKFGSPLFLGMILHSLFNIVDIVIVGNIPDRDIPNEGEKAIVALTLASFWNMLFMVIVNGISTSSVAMISKCWGQNDRAQGIEIARQSMLLMVWISVISAILGLFSRPLVGLLGAEGDILEMGTQYIFIQMIGACTMYFLLQITAVLRAAGDSFWPMVMLVGANLLNLFLDMWFVYGWGPVPRMGVVGAAWATIISRTVFLVLGFAVLVAGAKGMHMTLKGMRHQWGVLRQLLWIGLPSSLQITVRLVAYMVVMRLVMAEGDFAGTAFSITAGRLDMIVVFGAAGFGGAASAMVGQNLGAGKVRRASQSAWISVLYAAVVSGAMGVLFFAFAEPLMGGLFVLKKTIHPEVLSHAIMYLSILCPSYPFIAASLVFAQALNGSGDTRSPLAIDAAGFLLFQIPLALILRSAVIDGEPLGIRGVYLAMSITAVMLTIVYVFWFRSGRWSRKPAIRTA